MKIKVLTLQNFKNYENLALELQTEFNYYWVKTALGKQLLDALHYLTWIRLLLQIRIIKILKRSILFPHCGDLWSNFSDLLP